MPRRRAFVPAFVPALPLASPLAALLAAMLAAPPALAQEPATATPAPAKPVHPAATLALCDDIPWRTDGQDFYDNDQRAAKVQVDRVKLLDDACAEAKQKGTLVLWYVHRIQEKTLR